MTDKVKITSAAELRDRASKQHAGEVLELSSGITVKVRRPNENALIQNGVIPGALAMSAVNVQTQKAGPTDLKNFAALQRLYAKLAVIEPEVVEGEATKDGQVSVDVFSADELNEIYLYVAGGMDGLKQFRTQRQRLSAGPDSAALPGDAA